MNHSENEQIFHLNFILYVKSLHFILAQSGNSIIASACPLKISRKEHN